MSAAWQDFLDTIGANVNARGDTVFSDDPVNLAELDQIAAVIPLAHYALLAVQGAEAAKFLQGQLTCHVLEVNAELSTPGAYCTVKGRVVTSFQLAQREPDHYWLRMRGDLIANAAQILGKYIVFSKAKATVREDLLAFGLHGSNASTLLREWAAAIPTGRNGTVALGNGLAVQLDEAGTRFECWLPQDEATAFWQRASAQCRPTGARYWHWLNIRAGLGEVSAATADAFIPQMLNYQLTGAVNFKKGCYTGQEIVARAQYRGQVKRHLLRASGSGPEPLPGADIIGANGQSIGSVIDAVTVAENRVELLAVLGGNDLVEGTAKLCADGPALQPLPLPYAIP